MVVKAWLRSMSAGGAGEGGDEAASRRWPVGILRRSGARAARRVLHVKYRSVPPAPSPAAPPHALPLDIDDTVSCFCRCVAVVHANLTPCLLLSSVKSPR